jgi:predicted enzyme related to lactoylglutathione lyase
MTKAYPHGTFSWVDLQTTDLAAAKVFYGELFGWELTDQPLPGDGVYTMASQAGKAITGMGELPAGMDGIPPHWNSYITVDDIDATTAMAAELGGVVIEQPFAVMDAGRMSLIQDPTGGMVALWETINHRGSDIFNLPGALSWNELMTHDVEMAKAFYTALIGWTAETDEGGYTMWANNGRPNGGMMAIAPEMGPMPPNWSVYFAVEDINAAVEKAQALGGTVFNGPMEIGAAGSIAIIADPQGAVFTAIQLNNPDTDLPGE